MLYVLKKINEKTKQNMEIYSQKVHPFVKKGKENYINLQNDGCFSSS